ncbi:hypothetical protein L9F63_007588, partial [Diploptera punctata]
IFLESIYPITQNIKVLTPCGPQSQNPFIGVLVNLCSSPCDTAQQTLSSGDSSGNPNSLQSRSDGLSAPLRVRLLSRCRLPTAEHQGRPSSASVAAGVGLRTTVCFPLALNYLGLIEESLQLAPFASHIVVIIVSVICGLFHFLEILERCSLTFEVFVRCERHPTYSHARPRPL